MGFIINRNIRKAEKEVDKARRGNKPDYYSPLIDSNINDTRISSFPEERETEPVIGAAEVKKATETLLKYKAGKANLESRIISNEQWFKGRHWEQMGETSDNSIKPASAWLFNCIMSKYADYMDAYPEPNILPREEGDKQEAEVLTSIIPVILEQNGFYKVYSNEAWKKLKDGSGIYGVFWDGQKLNGVGDISIRNIDFLNLFWLPGIMDIQESPHVFHVNLIANEQLEVMYPQLKGKLGGESITKAEYIYDDSVDTSDKSVVVDWYYKKYIDGRSVLHYVKYVNDIVLFASENEVQRPTETVEEPDIDAETGENIVHTFEVETGEESLAERGWYDHGMYPFIIDTMFPVEGSLCGFSYIDICKEPQKYIDLLDQAVLTNALMNARTRYFSKTNGIINEEEFLDWTKPIIHVSGDLSELTMRRVEPPEMNGSAMAKINDKINEMKETTGNTDVSRGSIGGGITSGSAISALQESAGKTSRSQNKMGYQAYSEVITMVIELVRQFYDIPRQFRITGKNGYEFKSYSNANIKPQEQDSDFDVKVGYRVPMFDIEVTAQKQNPYTKNSQNELALSLYGAGFFAPQNSDAALACIDVMDFAHKEDIVSKIERNAGIYNENIMLKQQLVELAAELDGTKGSNLTGALQQQFGMQEEPGVGERVPDTELNAGEEHPFNERAREQAMQATQVN